jgi:uncharacterized membrane-anchored protein YitT (DUF2179 family)
MRYVFVFVFLVGFIFPVFAQLNVCASIGNSNFRKIIPYSGSVVNFPLTLFAKGCIGHDFAGFTQEMNTSFSVGMVWFFHNSD